MIPCHIGTADTVQSDKKKRIPIMDGGIVDMVG